MIEETDTRGYWVGTFSRVEAGYVGYGEVVRRHGLMIVLERSERLVSVGWRITWRISTLNVRLSSWSRT